MIPVVVRTPAQLRAARQRLGLSADGLARMVRVEDGRTVRRWEAGERHIPGPVTVLLETAMGYLAKRDMIIQQLEMLRSGTMKTGTNFVDDTEVNIARLTDAKAEYEAAFELLTRQPVGLTATQVHWYQLRRMTPLFEANKKDEWSVPGEVSCEGALAYFTKHGDVGGELELCDDFSDAEFVLEQRRLLRNRVPLAHLNG
jgi:hypothetical protein